MYLLGYDIGSSSVKASLVDAQTGKCAASAFYPKSEAAIIAVKPGWAEQDPASWWEYLKLATSDIMASTGVDPKEIILEKMDISAKKYPVEKAKGVSTKYNKF